MPKPPAAAKIDPLPAPVSDDRRVGQAAENAARRAANRRDTQDTDTGTSTRRRGGLAGALRTKIGG